MNCSITYARAFSPPGANTNATVAGLEVTDAPLAPVLYALSYTNGQFRFTLGGRPNIDYVIEVSTNLQTWVAVLTNRDNCPTRLIVLTAPPESRRFYRAFAP